MGLAGVVESFSPPFMRDSVRRVTQALILISSTHGTKGCPILALFARVGIDEADTRCLLH